MKKLITLCSLILLTFATSLTAQSSGHHIQFKIKGLEDSTKIQLAYYYGQKKLLQDTAFVINNEFEFKDTTSLPKGLYIVIVPGNGFFDIIVNEDQNFEIETKLENLNDNIVIKNHEENTDFYKYLKDANPLNRELSDLHKKWAPDSCSEPLSKECETLRQEILDLKEDKKELALKFIKDHPNYVSSAMFKAMEDVEVPMFTEIKDDKERQEKRFNYYKEHYFDNTNFDETGLIRTPIFEGVIDKYFNELTHQTCDSVKKSADLVMAHAHEYDMFRFLLNHITHKYETTKIMCMDCMNLHMFSNYYLKDERVDWLNKDKKRQIEEETWKLSHNQCGQVAYPMTQKDTNGVEHDILKTDAEYTIVYFWSATCGHCKKATPKLKEMYDRIKDEYDVEVYSVHIDKKRKEYDKFVKKHQFTWISTIVDGTDNKFRTAYNVFSTPTIYLLNHKKEIIAKKVDIATMERMITGKMGTKKDDLLDIPTLEKMDEENKKSHNH